MTKIDILRQRREEADAYSVTRNLDKWGFRVAWIALSEGARAARTLCARYNKQSPAWICYQNLIAAGLLVEKPEWGIVYSDNAAWEEGDGPLRWLEALSVVAAGGARHPLL